VQQEEVPFGEGEEEGILELEEGRVGHSVGGGEALHVYQAALE